LQCIAAIAAIALASGCGGGETSDSASGTTVTVVVTETVERAPSTAQQARARAAARKEAAERAAAEAARKREEARQRAERGRAKNKQRQQELVAAGYKVAIDGVWGPQSEGAWQDYKLRLSPTYVEEWAADVVALIDDLLAASEVIWRSTQAIELGATYSKREFDAALSRLAACASSTASPKPPVGRAEFDDVRSQLDRGCSTYDSAREQIPVALKDEASFSRFHGVQQALTTGDDYVLNARNSVVGWAMGGIRQRLVVPPSSTPSDEDLGSGGDLDCEDVDGPVIIEGDDPHGLDGDGDGIGSEAG
jgi:hypothetical protein